MVYLKNKEIKEVLVFLRLDNLHSVYFILMKSGVKIFIQQLLNHALIFSTPVNNNCYYLIFFTVHPIHLNSLLSYLFLFHFFFYIQAVKI